MVVKDDQTPRTHWKIGRVVDIIKSHDGYVRSARIFMPSKRVITRPVNHLFPLELHVSPATDNANSTSSNTPHETQRTLRPAAAQALQRLAALYDDR